VSAEGSPDAETETVNVPSDVCGCTMTSIPTGTNETEAHSEDNVVAPGDSVVAPHRAVKLVVFLRPSGAGYLAQIAVGAEGCDPQLRALSVPTLTAALDLLPELHAQAQARWLRRPRYPSIVPKASSRTTRSAPVHQAAVPTQTPAAPSRTAPHSTGPTQGATTPTDQLSLFG
jgi:hypothetical protein